MTKPNRPGPYRFQDAIGGPAQTIEVIEVDGELLARFPAADGDDGADVPVADIAGEFEGPLPASV